VAIKALVITSSSAVAALLGKVLVFMCKSSDTRLMSFYTLNTLAGFHIPGPARNTLPPSRV